MFSVNLKTDCEAFELSDENLIRDFDCGDHDLNEFFNRDAIFYQDERLGKAFFHQHLQTGEVVCAFSLSADSIKTFLLTNNRRKKVRELIPREKALQS